MKRCVSAGIEAMNILIKDGRFSPSDVNTAQVYLQYYFDILGGIHMSSGIEKDEAVKRLLDKKDFPYESELK